MENQILEVSNIEKYYGSKGNVVKAINNISFQVEKGEFLGIMGPSGSGKTTLLNCISTIDKVTSGNILIGNEDITKYNSSKISKFRREKLGFIFQEVNLLDTLTSFENIALALTIIKIKKQEIEKKINEVARTLNIEDILDKFPFQLSGGQKQRVAAARAIITKPLLILADEPTGALDSRASKMLLENFRNLNEVYSTTIMMVTHDAFSASFASRILFIKDGKIFNEILRGKDTRREFFDKIIEVVTLLGGDPKIKFKR